MWGHRRDRRFQRGVLKKDMWSCCRRASRELSLIRIVSTLLPGGLQRTFCPCDGYLSLSTTSSLTGANYLKTQNKILGSRKDVLLLHPFPGHLLRAAPTPHVPLPSANPTEAGNCRGCFCLPSRDTKLWFFSCAVAAVAVLPCRHLVAMTYEVVDVPERESINLTGTRLSTYIPC